MSQKNKIDTKSAPAAIGPYSQAIEANGVVYCSGQIPLNPETMQLETADVVVQTKRVLSNLTAVLKAAGSSPAKIVKATVFLTDLKNFEAFNKEYESWLAAEAAGVPPPARSTIQISALPRASMVEVEAIALK
jgi:2-iminobutanoate/2-iminopropanoate deaminase